MLPNLTWWWGACIGVGAIICIFVVLPAVMKKYGMSKKSNDFYSTLGLIAIAAGFGGAYLFQLFYDLVEYGFKLPATYWRYADGSCRGPGVTFLGGLITGAATFIVGTLFAKPEVKKEFWIILRAFAPCVCIAHAFGRIGCFGAGCCYGKETDSWLGIQFPGHTHKVLPTQLFEAIFLFALFAVCFLLTDKSMIIYLFSYGIFRFVLEFFRGDERAGNTSDFSGKLSPSQIICILLVAAGIVMLVLDITKGIFKKYTPPKPPELISEAPDLENTQI